MTALGTCHFETSAGGAGASVVYLTSTAAVNKQGAFGNLYSLPNSVLNA